MQYCCEALNQLFTPLVAVGSHLDLFINQYLNSCEYGFV